MKPNALGRLGTWCCYVESEVDALHPPSQELSSDPPRRILRRGCHRTALGKSRQACICSKKNMETFKGKDLFLLLWMHTGFCPYAAVPCASKRAASHGPRPTRARLLFIIEDVVNVMRSCRLANHVPSPKCAWLRNFRSVAARVCRPLGHTRKVPPV